MNIIRNILANDTISGLAEKNINPQQLAIDDHIGGLNNKVVQRVNTFQPLYPSNVNPAKHRSIKEQMDSCCIWIHKSPPIANYHQQKMYSGNFD
ncbi:hypothetical protein HZS_3352 [Henneguya salminicola]|nr:hypothetical protein HZS_3352 [Henneguya salminicola]